ncbi:MAG: carbohydrate-binding domain-containing protein [Lachnospiraceae bacterium]|nr:carbohydrate-binding domain-containing protein [Lachnospiraceae bacterium]
MKAIRKLLACILAAAFVCSLAACNKETNNRTEGTEAGTSVRSESTSAQSETEEESTEAKSPLSDPEDSGSEASGDFSVKAADGTVVSAEGFVYTITAAGEYTAAGSLEDGQIVIDAGEEDEVVLVLQNASISCSTGAPILCISADELTIRSEEGSYNTVTDFRTASAAENTDDSDEEEVLNDNAAIYSKCDLKLTGKGTLIVSSEYDNGVKSTKDLSIKNVTLKVTSPGAALKGNDSVTVKSGSIIAVSTGSDGVKASDSDISSKGNQRGTILIEGGQLDIYAQKDGISAAYNVEITPAEGENPVVNIYTASYSDYGSEITVGTEFYLAVSSSLYDEDSDYYLYFYDDNDQSGTYVKAEYDTMIYSGRTPYYGLLVKAPSAQNMLINIVEKGISPDGSNYTAATSGETFNTSMNGYLITDVSGSSISGDWISISSGSGGGNSDKTAWSSKGIKAENEIIINGGTLTVHAMDDGLHANGGTELENGEKSIGNITVNAGSITVVCADDGMHADSELTINGGTVQISESHEGLEGNVININGGTITVYGNDDGLNAGKGSVTPLINITGGTLDVTTPSGDTDGIDSNGDITISGGLILVKSGAQMGGMAGSVDLDGTLRVTGGTIIALGGICETPGSGSVNTYISNGTSFAAGNYSLQDSNGKEIAFFTLNGSYSSCWIASESFELNQSYSLVRDGSAVLSWTQSQQSEGDAGNSWGGPGGFGGRR